MRINQGETFVYIPETGEVTIQYGVDTTGDIQWSLSEEVDGVNINSDGLLTVLSTTNVSNLPDKEKIIHIEATRGMETVTLNLIICDEPDLSNPPLPPEEQMKQQIATLSQTIARMQLGGI